MKKNMDVSHLTVCYSILMDTYTWPVKADGFGKHAMAGSLTW